MSQESISVVLPAFNEEESIARVVNDAQSVLRSCSIEYEIIVVNDGSVDKTGEIIDELARSNNCIKTLHRSINKGYAAALRSGFSRAQKDLIFYTDADNQFVLSDLKKLLPLIEKADIVVGYRINRKDNFLRILASKVFNLIANLFFHLKIRDIDCAFKLFRSKIFEKIQIELEGFTVDLEILAKANRHKMVIKETGVEHLPRAGGKSTVRLKDILETIKGMIQLRKLLWREKSNVL